MVFTQYFPDISRVFHGCFKGFCERIKDVSSVLHLCFKEKSILVYGCFKGFFRGC